MELLMWLILKQKWLLQNQKALQIHEKDHTQDQKMVVHLAIQMQIKMEKRGCIWITLWVVTLQLFPACKSIHYLWLQYSNCNTKLTCPLTRGWHRAFSLFGERGKFLISGGNDKLVKIWNWSCYPDVGLSDDNNNNILHLNIEVSRKVSFVIYLI